MTKTSNIFPLLESVVKDNETYKFPIEIIFKELTHLFINQEEFDYFMMQSFRTLKTEIGPTIAHIFLTTLETKMNLKETNVYQLPTAEYQSKIEDFISTLENLYITRIPKQSPDGEMLSNMI